MRILRALLLLPVLAALRAPSAPADGASALPTLTVPRVIPVRDEAGHLTAEDWKKAARLTLSDPWRQAPSFTPTEVRLLDTGSTLAIAFIARDDAIRATQTGRDTKTYLDDCVEIFLGRPEENLTEGIGLEFNALGALSDFRCREPELLDFAWQVSGERIRVERLASLSAFAPEIADGPGYLAVIELPWSAIRAGIVLPGNGAPDRLRANFGRWDRDAAGDVFTLWSDSRLPIPKPHRADRYGWLIFPARDNHTITALENAAEQPRAGIASSVSTP